MDSLIKSLTQHTGEILAVLLLSTLLFVGWLTSVSRRFSRQQSRWNLLLRGAGGEDLAQLLERHLAEREISSAEIDRLKSRVAELESKVATAKRHVGLVRYDAFQDVGGTQSFTLAVYDDQGNGAVITSIVGRNDCRVYCKPLLNGSSERTLSQEEQRAIREARSDAPRVIVSS